MRKLLTLLASSTLAGALHAAPPTDDSVSQLLEVTQASRVMDLILPGMDAMNRQMIAAGRKGQSFTPQQQREMDAVASAITKMLREELSWESLKPYYIQLYQESYTQEEVDGQIAFYKSPVGVSMVTKMPIVAQKSIAVMQTRMGPLVEKIKFTIDKAIAQAKAAQ